MNRVFGNGVFGKRCTYYIYKGENGMVMLLFVLLGAFLVYACCAAAGREDDRAEAYWSHQKK